jgi:hypothetical protein
MRFLSEAGGKNLNPRRTQKPETVFETVRKRLYAGSFGPVRQFVRHDSAAFDVKTDNVSYRDASERQQADLVLRSRDGDDRDRARTWTRREPSGILLS